MWDEMCYAYQYVSLARLLLEMRDDLVVVYRGAFRCEDPASLVVAQGNAVQSNCRCGHTHTPYAYRESDVINTSRKWCDKYLEKVYLWVCLDIKFGQQGKHREE